MMGKQGIVLIGMAGVGKSTIGSALARALGFNFTDLDEYIREKDGQTVQEVIDTRGEEALLQLEKQRMLELDMQRKRLSEQLETSDKPQPQVTGRRLLRRDVGPRK